MRLATGEQPRGWFADQSAIMLSQFVEQMRTEHHVTVLAALALMNMEDHALGIDVGDLQVSQFCPPYSSGIEGHQDGAVKLVRRRFD